jgi:hypothetical protein
MLLTAPDNLLRQKKGFRAAETANQPKILKIVIVITEEEESIRTCSLGAKS